MKKYKYIQTMVASGIKKGTQYIEEHPKRGIRNLLDLGEHFASGRFQKPFFDVAHEVLNNEDSFYYDKIEDLVKSTNHSIITGFGTNLAYNSFTYGASVIREREKELNYKIPWTIVFDFRQEEENSLKEYEVLNIINKARSYGIYSYLILVDRNDIFVDFYSIIKDNDDCAFSLIVSPKILDEQSVKYMSSLNNLCFYVLINDTDVEVLYESANYLRRERCLYGGCYYYDSDSCSYILEDEMLSKIVLDMHANFVMLIQRSNCNKDIKKEIYDYVHESRFKTDSAAFVIEFYSDIKRISNIISDVPKENHFLGIDSLGQISLGSVENKLDYNIRTSSFEDILKITV